MALGGGGGGGGGGAIRAGRAFVEFFAKDAGLRTAIGNIQKRLMKTGKMFTQVGTGMIVGGLARLAPLGFLFKSGLDRANQLKDLSDAFGLTAEGVSKLGYASEVAGLEMEDLDTMLFKLARSNTTGKPLDEYFLDVVDSLNAIPDDSIRATKAFELLGKGGKKLLPTLGDIRNRMGEAPLISPEVLADAEKFDQDWKAIFIHLSAGMVQFVRTLAPVVEWFKELAKESGLFLKIAVATSIASVGLGIAFIAVGAAITGVVTVIGAVASVIGFLLTPLGLVVAAVAALVFGFIKLTGLGSTLGDTFAGVADALAVGDLETAWALTLKGLELEWVRLVESMTNVWNDFKSFFVDGFHSAIYLIKRELNDWQAWTAKLIVDMVAGLQDMLGKETLGKLGIDLLGGADPEQVKRILESERRLDQSRMDKQFSVDQDGRDMARKGDLLAAQTMREGVEARRQQLLDWGKWKDVFGGGAGAGAGTGKPGAEIAGAVRGAFAGFGSLESTFGGGGPTRELTKRLDRIVEKTDEEIKVMEEVARQLGNLHGEPVWGF